MYKRIIRRVYNTVPLKPQLFTLVREAAPPLPEKLYKHLHFHGPMSVRINTERSFRMHHCGTADENGLFWGGLFSGYEATSLRLWCRLVTTASVIIDAGANMGVYCLSAKCMNPGAFVAAFEPVKRIHERLVANIDLNGFDIAAEPVALSDESGFSKFYDLPDEHAVNASLHSSVPALEADCIEIEVPTMRLDDYMSRRKLRPPDLIKLDVERAEPAVLRGLGAVLFEKRPTLIIEILTDDVAHEVWDLLAGSGYHYFRIHEGRGVSATSTLSPQGVVGQNFLACQPSVIDAIRLDELAVRSLD
jgi:FkbM family methyltransferase